jgi:uncharacterized membrane protein
MISFMKAIHVLGTTLFVGDIILMMMWKLRAERTRDTKVLLFANRTIMLTDQFILTPSVLLLMVSGNLRAYLTKIPVWHTPTLAISVAFFALSGLVWFFFLVPNQKRQLKICSELGANKELPEAYFGLTRQWNRWAHLATFLVVTAMFSMAIH